MRLNAQEASTLAKGFGTELFDDQEEMVDRLFFDWAGKNTSGKNEKAMVQMPTGSGKTPVLSSIASYLSIIHKKNILVLVHRDKLNEQIEGKFNEFGVYPKTAFGTSPKNNIVTHPKITLCSIQSFQSRFMPPADVIIVDEAHHTSSPQYEKLFKIYSKADKLGFTATPYRLDGKGFTHLFDTLLCSGQIQEFIDRGRLCSARIVRQEELNGRDFSKIKKLGREFVFGENYFSGTDFYAEMVGAYEKYAEGKKMIAFNASIQDSIGLVDEYIRRGHNAIHIDSYMTKEEREKRFDIFKNEKNCVLSNVGLVSEGFDIPGCEAVQLGVLRNSLTDYLQMIGRCVRVDRNNPGKREGLVLDHMGNYNIHGAYESDRFWTLKGTGEEKDNLRFQKGKKGAVLTPFEGLGM